MWSINFMLNEFDDLYLNQTFINNQIDSYNYMSKYT